MGPNERIFRMWQRTTDNTQRTVSSFEEFWLQKALYKFQLEDKLVGTSSGTAG